MQQLKSKPGLLGLCSNLSQCKIVLMKSETVYLRSELGSLALLVYSIFMEMWERPLLVLKKMVYQIFKRLWSSRGKILASCCQLQILRRKSKLEKKQWDFFSRDGNKMTSGFPQLFSFIFGVVVQAPLLFVQYFPNVTFSVLVLQTVRFLFLFK